MLNNSGAEEDAFQTFFQTCSMESDPSFEEGVIPSRSIFKSPSTSIGIGCGTVEEGSVNGLSVSVARGVNDTSTVSTLRRSPYQIRRVKEKDTASGPQCYIFGFGS